MNISDVIKDALKDSKISFEKTAPWGQDLRSLISMLDHTPVSFGHWARDLILAAYDQGYKAAIADIKKEITP